MGVGKEKWDNGGSYWESITGGKIIVVHETYKNYFISIAYYDTQ